MGISIKTAIVNCNKDTNLAIIIFEYGYSAKSKHDLVSLSKNHDNISIRFLDMNRFVSSIKTSTVSRLSVTCYAKLFCTDNIFSNYERVITTDSDLLF